MNLYSTAILAVSLAAASIGKPPAGFSGPDGTNTYSVVAPVRELPKGFLAWLHKHPEAMTQGDSANGESPSYSIRWPYLEIYSPSGISIFHGSDSDNNIKLLRSLPFVLPSTPSAATKLIRPTLGEVEAMFPEIQRAGVPDPSRGEYTVFAIYNPERSACAAQDAAIQELKKRVAGTKVRIVEVRLKAEEE